ncbi:MAG: hypothetical protein KC505_09640 [Myxococcales bacterium]|nr:hypothetical protein [Myxococcales bacterium]USN50000.1 MAG: hypothetical protein H6731_06920 [Myxococcales bacterium]
MKKFLGATALLLSVNISFASITVHTDSAFLKQHCLSYTSRYRCKKDYKNCYWSDMRDSCRARRTFESCEDIDNRSYCRDRIQCYWSTQHFGCHTIRE